jgi:hypothetical protein
MRTGHDTLLVLCAALAIAAIVLPLGRAERCVGVNPPVASKPR